MTDKTPLDLDAIEARHVTDERSAAFHNLTGCVGNMHLDRAALIAEVRRLRAATSPTGDEEIAEIEKRHGERITGDQTFRFAWPNQLCEESHADTDKLLSALRSARAENAKMIKDERDECAKIADKWRANIWAGPAPLIAEKIGAEIRARAAGGGE